LVVKSLPRRQRPRMITTEHNPWNTFKTPTRLLNAATSALDDVTFAVSEEARASMTRRAATHTKVLTHGIDVAATREQRLCRSEVRRELGVDDGTVLVGTVANYHPKKDWPNLLSAAGVIRDRNLPIKFLAVGQGPLVREVEAKHRELELDGVVTLTGFRP